MTHRLVIIGAGSIGFQVATRLKSSHQTLLLDVDENAFANLADPVSASKALDELAGRAGLKLVRADGTSRLVLDSLFTDQTPCSLMATTGAFEANLEICRLGKEIGFDPVLAVAKNTKDQEEFRNIGITSIHVSALVAEQLDRSLKFSGAVLPVGVGLGKGELMEIRLVRTSPVLHRPLKDLAPHRWRVAAVFRDEQLIVPTGTTTLEQDDRVLLVGDPNLLPTVSEYIRLGTPQFPRQFGPNVVTLEWQGADEAMAKEAQNLVKFSKAAKLIRGIGKTATSRQAPSEEDASRESFVPPSLYSDSFGSRLKAQLPGIVVSRAPRRTFLQRIVQRRGQDTELCDRCACPVLFARGQDSYNRILLPVSESDLNIHAAETAIDISRQFKLPILSVNVDPPAHISGLAQEDLHHEVEPIRRLCQLYDVALDYHHHEGNPIAKILLEATENDLLLMARRFGRADTYFSPDVALRVARQAPCSVLVLTIAPD